MHQKNRICAVKMRMRVPVGRLAVGSPAGVSNGGSALPGLPRDFLFQRNHSSNGFFKLNFSAVPQSHSGGVVSAILQSLKPVHNYRQSVPFSNISHNSAHVYSIITWQM